MLNNIPDPATELGATTALDAPAMGVELLPCPMCANRAFITYGSVWCLTDRCLRLPSRETNAEAIAAWNTRTATLAPVDRVDRARVEGYEAAIRSAYIAGATDVHNNWQADRDPDFGEAAGDYFRALKDTPENAR